MKRFALALCFLLSAAALADEPVKQPPPAPWIVFPEVSQPPAPPLPLPPPPSPDTIPRLTADQVYVIDAKEPCFLIASPAGLVSVTQDAGPVKIRGRFLGGSGKYETKTFSGAAVFTVEAVSRGRVELIVVKVGAKGATDIVRRTVDVDAGTGPQPPPPGPTPDPFNPLATKFRAAYQTDRAANKGSPEYLPKLEAVLRDAARNVNKHAKLGDALLHLVKDIQARAAIPAGYLPALRQAISDAMKTMLPTDGNTTMTFEIKAQCESVFGQIADALKGAAQ